MASGHDTRAQASTAAHGGHPVTGDATASFLKKSPEVCC